MPKRYSSKNFEKVANKCGFFKVRQKGSHMTFKNQNGKSVTVVANKKQIPPGTFGKMCSDIGLSISEFEQILKNK